MTPLSARVEGNRWVIPLPYDKPVLSMNDSPTMSRGAVFAKAALKRRVRADVMNLALAHRLPRNVAHVTVQLHYAPRDNRRRDTDNLVATLKPICDALAAGTTRNPGYGLVADDTPQYMSKPEPIIHDKTGTGVGRMWLEITITEHEETIEVTE